MTDDCVTHLWQDPLDVARALAAEGHADMVLLHSTRRTGYTGRYSYLACRPMETVQTGGFSALAGVLTDHLPWHRNAWFGYLGYGLRHDTEFLPGDEPGWLTLPDLYMTRYASILRWDHDSRALEGYGEPLVWNLPPSPVIPMPSPGRPRSNMTRAGYMEKLGEILEAIRSGSLYQANLTRKFYGEWQAPPEDLALFERLCDISPAGYGAYMRFGDAAVLSSSPERFLSIDSEGKVDTRPIKGSAPRGGNASEDAAIVEALQHSAKDRAENLMIVDLMRNDLARCCEIGSVKVESLYDLATYATVHHLSSTVTGQKRHDATALDVVKACFPPGSMTGAPKIRAMELCTRLERQARGLYSGAIGWFGGDGTADLSVVIRTLIAHGRQWEFQVGGGIVADSDAESEWRETLIKARGIATAIGLDMAVLAAL